MEPCSLCGLSPEDHRRAELAGDINHRFAKEAGDLAPSQNAKPRTMPPTPYVGAREDQVLLKLIAVLTEKGILTGPDLQRVLGGQVAVRPSTDGADTAARTGTEPVT